jgi:hypothetical protein
MYVENNWVKEITSGQNVAQILMVGDILYALIVTAVLVVLSVIHF